MQESFVRKFKNLTMYCKHANRVRSQSAALAPVHMTGNRKIANKTVIMHRQPVGPATAHSRCKPFHICVVSLVTRDSLTFSLAVLRLRDRRLNVTTIGFTKPPLAQARGIFGKFASAKLKSKMISIYLHGNRIRNLSLAQ